MATHTLPTYVNHLGTFTVTVTTDVAGLTTPTENTIRDLAGGNESLELLPGMLNRSPMSITVLDTPDAFWSQVCAGESFIMVTLNEGSGATFAFAGDIATVSTKGQELYNDGTTAFRLLTIHLDSPLERLRDTTVEAVLLQFKVNAEIAATTPSNGYYAPVLAIFAAAIEAAFSQSYLLTDAYLQCGSGDQDFQFNDGSSDLDLDEIYIKTQDAVDYVGYLKSSESVYWPSNYDNAYELIKDIALNFGVIPRYDYDPSGARHRIQLLQRGRCFSSAVTLLAPRTSGFVYSSYMILNKVSVLWPTDTSLGWYWNYGPVTAAPPPSWLEPELEIVCNFVAGYDLSTYPTVEYQRLWSMATGDPVQIDVVKSWNYSTASMDTYNSGVARLEKALLTYFVNRYPGAGQVTYNRTFPLMRAEGGSHTAIQPMSIVPVGGVDYTAIECDKDWTTGEATLVLVKL